MSYKKDTASPHVTYVPAPESDARLTVACGAQNSLHFAFDPSAATLTRPEGTNDLAFALEDGGIVTLQGFFPAPAGLLSELVFPDGTVIGAADFLAAASQELVTQSGPGAAVVMSGSGPRYNDDPGELLEGVDKLGKLGLAPGGRAGHGLSDDLSPGDGRAARGAAADDGGPNGVGEGERHVPTFVSEPDELRVHEDGLSGGSNSGADGHPTTATGSLALASGDALASIALGGLTLTITGIAADGTVSYLVAGEAGVPHGEFFVTGLSWADGVYTLSYSYTLQEASHSHDDNSATTGGHEELPEAIAIQVTATDVTGDVASGDITLQIHDDAPSQLAPDAVTLHADSGLVAASLHAVWGADGPHASKGLYFDPKGEPAADGGYPSGLTSNGAPISYYLSEDGVTLTAMANGEAVFTVRLDGVGNGYTVELSGVVDPGVYEDVLHLSGARPGSGGTAYLNTDPSSPAIAYDTPGQGHLVATVTGGTADGPGTLNNNADCMGVNNQSFDAGQWMLFAFEKPQNMLSISSPANRIKGEPKGEWVAYDENGVEVGRGAFEFDEKGFMTIDTGNTVFYDIRLTMTSGSCGVGAVTCNSSKEYLDAQVELPVTIMDGDGDACSGGIDITFKPGDEPAPEDAGPAYAHAEVFLGAQTSPDLDGQLAAMAAAEDDSLFIPKSFGAAPAPAPEAGEVLSLEALVADASAGAEPLDALLATLPPGAAEASVAARADAGALPANGAADANDAGAADEAGAGAPALTSESGWSVFTLSSGSSVYTSADSSTHILIESGLGML